MHRNKKKIRGEIAQEMLALAYMPVVMQLCTTLSLPLQPVQSFSHNHKIHICIVCKLRVCNISALFRVVFLLFSHIFILQNILFVVLSYVRSQQNAQWVQSSLLSEVRIVGLVRVVKGLTVHPLSSLLHRASSTPPSTSPYFSSCANQGPG